MSTCIHFSGPDQPTCALGIPYTRFGWRRGSTALGLPCVRQDPRPRGHCPHFEDEAAYRFQPREQPPQEVC